MERKYSASPGERFYTGGGLLTFENFERADNARILTVREGVQRSVNLVFIRLMRDIVRHTAFNMASSSATLLEDDTDPKRREYLARFADREGREFIARFYKKYQGQAPAEAEARLLQGIRPTPRRLAPIFRTLEPNGSLEQFHDFLRRSLPDARIDDANVSRLYDDYSTQRFDLADRGYLAGVHPLELWLVGFLRQHPRATLAQAIDASADERQNVYRWLFKTRHKSAQDNRIRTLIEVEAFLEIHKMWKRLGYPFESLVPSYATALGSSADRPAALAELMGILVNDGVRVPNLWLDRLAFAVDTPYETRLAYSPGDGERVLPSEVAAGRARGVGAGGRGRLRPTAARRVHAPGRHTADDGRQDRHRRPSVRDLRETRCADFIARGEPFRRVCVLYRRAPLRRSHGLRQGAGRGKLQVHQRAAGANPQGPGAEADGIGRQGGKDRDIVRQRRAGPPERVAGRGTSQRLLGPTVDGVDLPARKRIAAAAPDAPGIRRGSRSGYRGFHSSARRCASAICAGVIRYSILSRSLTAASRPALSDAVKRETARFDHLCAST